MDKFFTRKEADFICNLLRSSDTESVLLGLSLFFKNVTKPNLIIKRYPKFWHRALLHRVSQKYSVKTFKRFWIYYREHVTEHHKIPSVFIHSIEDFILKRTFKNK